MKSKRKRTNKTMFRRTQKLAESSYKLGYATGAQEMAKRSADIMQKYLDEQAELRYVGDVLGYIGMAVWLEKVILSQETIV